MITSYFNTFNTTTEKPDIHLMNMVNYNNALNQLNICFFYKYINNETTKLFGMNESNTITNPFFDIAMKYQQESMVENIQENISNMCNIILRGIYRWKQHKIHRQFKKC